MTIYESFHSLPLGCSLAILSAITFLSTRGSLNALTRVAHEAVPLSSHFLKNALFLSTASELSCLILSISAGCSPSTKARLLFQIVTVMSEVPLKTATIVGPIMIIKKWSHI